MWLVFIKTKVYRLFYEKCSTKKQRLSYYFCAERLISLYSFISKTIKERSYIQREGLERSLPLMRSAKEDKLDFLTGFFIGEQHILQSSRTKHFNLWVKKLGVRNCYGTFNSILLKFTTAMFDQAQGCENPLVIESFNLFICNVCLLLL